MKPAFAFETQIINAQLNFARERIRRPYRLELKKIWWQIEKEGRVSDRRADREIMTLELLL